MAVDHNNPQSRDEEILIATIDGTEYNKNPQSRMEELLLELKETIEEGGGGGGTSDYENLSNQPQVNGETLIGDKSGADLGLVDAEEGKGLSTNDYDDTEKAAVAAATSAISAMQDGSDIDSFGDVEVALLDKQDELTAGKYIQITNDEISVKRDIAYEADEVFFAEQTNNGLHVSVTIGSTTLYDENFVTSDPNHTVLDLVQTSFNFRSVRWIVKYLKASKTQSAGYENIVWPSLTDTFVTTVDADKKLIIQSEMDAAINSAVSKCYHHAGTKTCAELLPAILVAANEGNVYEITDSGTTTSDFMEGIGHPIKEGDNVGVARVSDGVYKFDLLSGFVDTTNFVQKSSTAGLIMNDGTIDTVAKQPVTDNNLTTTDKTTTGAINELKSGFTNLDNEVNGDATVYPYADVITIEDAVPANLADCNVKIEPVQDLHGYDKPWVGGADKNKFATSFSNVDTQYIGCDEFSVDAGDYVFKFKNTSSSAIAYWASDTSDITDTTTYYVSAGQTASVNYTVGAGGKVKLAMRYNPITSGITPSDISEVALYKANDVPDTYRPYENICPISGHTEAVVTDAPLVDWEHPTVNDASLLTYVNNVLTVYGNNNNRSVTYTLPIIKKGLQHMTMDASMLPSQGGSAGRVGIIDGETVIYESEVFRSDTHIDFTFTTNSDYVKLKMYCTLGGIVYPSSGVAFSDITFNGDLISEPIKTYTIALGSTIYGGTVDFDSGVMTVDRAVVDLGDFAWGTPSAKGAVNSTTSISGAINPQSNYDKANMDCSQYQVLPYYIDGVAGHDANSTDGSFAIWASEGNKLYVRDLNLAGKTAEEIKTYLTGVQVLYHLATPLTVQLTPQQIQLLKGTNTLTASTGQISVTVNGVSGSIGAVQEQVNGLAESVAEDFIDIIGYIKRKNVFNPYSTLMLGFGSTTIGNTGIFVEGSYGAYVFKAEALKYVLSGADFSKVYDSAIRVFLSNEYPAVGVSFYRANNLSSNTAFDTNGYKYVCFLVQWTGGTTIGDKQAIQVEAGSVATTHENYKEVLDVLLDRVPYPPTADGTYNLQVTVASGTPTYSWVSGS